MTDAALIMVAPNGARRTKADHPALPIGANELGRVAARCAQAGAGAIHLHVRDANDAHTLDVDIYRAAFDAVRAAAGPDLVIQVTTEAVGRYQPHQQIAVMRQLRPQAFSAAIGELVADANHERPAAAFYAWAEAENIAVQHILYQPTEVDRFADLVRRGVIAGDRHALIFVLGRYVADQESDAKDLLAFLAALETCGLAPKTDWMVCAFGRGETAGATAALSLGGHARVGFENSLWRADGGRAADNAERVAALSDIAAVLGRPRATAEAVLRLLGGR
jgi:3-keto-5-aminohexanoate cleavage enzyme